VRKGVVTLSHTWADINFDSRNSYVFGNSCSPPSTTRPPTRLLARLKGHLRGVGTKGMPALLFFIFSYLMIVETSGVGYRTFLVAAGRPKSPQNRR
jgi:hypothetical protein